MEAQFFSSEVEQLHLLQNTSQCSGTFCFQLSSHHVFEFLALFQNLSKGQLLGFCHKISPV
ncbi:hypothetical protein AC251_05775 [Ralstonia pseudosolanacearum]|nr:hypothetical protein AC251_05775 [Ralstonia pseudosolanacearum]